MKDHPSPDREPIRPWPPASEIAALVTGGGTGIGFACAEALLRRGAKVALCGRREKGLRDAVSRLKASGAAHPGSVVATPGDITQADDVRGVVAMCVSRLGAVNVLVNSAGVWCEGAFTDLTASDWDDALARNLRAPAVVSGMVAKAMIRQGDGGRIIHIGSISGAIGEPGWAHYSAAKAGVTSLTRTMAVELAGHGIRTNAVAPGWIETDMTRDYFAQIDPASYPRLNPLGRVGLPAEIAAVVCFLAADAPDFLTGQVIDVDGGQGVAASMPDIL